MKRILIFIMLLSAAYVCAADVTKSVIEVEGMTCDLCVSEITAALQKVKGVEKVSVDLETGEVTIDHKNVDLMAINSAIEKAGFNSGEKELKNHKCLESKNKSCTEYEKSNCNRKCKREN